MPTPRTTPRTTPVFALPDHLAATSEPALTAADERHFAAVAASIDAAVADIETQLDAARRAGVTHGQEALERDQQVQHLTGRLRVLRRFSLDLCLGRMVPAEGEPVYVGRLGLTGTDGRRLLVDWRSPAAEPFFGATPADPRGLVSRRRYRWTQGRVTDFWDEALTPPAPGAEPLALDDDSAFLASLSEGRSSRMRDVLGTIQADQDAIVRAGSRGALVVDGGPGTGKTVVALHRAAYLIHADPRLGEGRGGVLFVGPHRPYLAYVADVLPSLGEEAVRTCTLRDLLPEGAGAGEESDPEVARLKSTAAMVGAVEPAVRLYEEPPTESLLVETPWVDLWIGRRDWAEAFGTPDAGTPHNEARDDVRDALVEILVDQVDEDEVPHETLRRALRQSPAIAEVLGRSWPLLEPTDVVGDLWTVPAYLRRCAPWLAPEEVRLLQRADPHAWTIADLPVLDAARRRLGDPETSRRRRRHEAAFAAQRERVDSVVDRLIEVGADPDEGVGLVTMLRHDDLRDQLVDLGDLPVVPPDRLAGPFAHVVVDEAQELTDAEWQMVLQRCPSRSVTVVGDRAQSRRGFTEPWAERLERVGFDQVRLASLTVGYRTPEEVMAVAEPVIRAALPDANVPTAIRSSGVPVRHGDVAELADVLTTWLAEHADGTACVIGRAGAVPPLPDPVAATGRVRVLDPVLAKGLEFDLVVLLHPAGYGEGVVGAVDRYVAMTRATRELVVLGR
ncbi:MAG TPA: RNA polymerase recycling motor ATPase HelR [Nocardioides sp.]